MEAGLDGPPAQVAEAGGFLGILGNSLRHLKKLKKVKNTLLDFFIVLYSTVLRINADMCF